MHLPKLAIAKILNTTVRTFCSSLSRITLRAGSCPSQTKPSSLHLKLSKSFKIEKMRLDYRHLRGKTWTRRYEHLLWLMKAWGSFKLLLIYTRLKASPRASVQRFRWSKERNLWRFQNKRHLIPKILSVVGKNYPAQVHKVISGCQPRSESK